LRHETGRWRRPKRCTGGTTIHTTPTRLGKAGPEPQPPGCAGGHVQRSWDSGLRSSLCRVWVGGLGVAQLPLEMWALAQEDCGLQELPSTLRTRDPSLAHSYRLLRDFCGRGNPHSQLRMEVRAQIEEAGTTAEPDACAVERVSDLTNNHYPSLPSWIKYILKQIDPLLLLDGGRKFAVHEHPNRSRPHRDCGQLSHARSTRTARLRNGHGHWPAPPERVVLNKTFLHRHQ